MPSDYRAWSRQVYGLHRALAGLRPITTAVGLEPPDGEEWYELLERKLLPQLAYEPLLVVAVVGGTNIGKSALFNHLAGEVASRVSPLAAGTKHPMCLVPEGFDDPATLERLFAGFQVRAWQSADDPLAETAEHRLFWRVGASVPPRLLLLDTPDIDSDAAVNWERADHVRQAADVLVAVLTQQKYNDAAVKQFFRKAAAADKPVVVVFNQCDMQEDRDYWPRWLETFAVETGARPELVYVVPYDRPAVDALGLTFHDVGRDGRQPPGRPSSLRDELAALHFDQIKIRTFRGALAGVLDDERGVRGYLRRIRRESEKFSASLRVLTQDKIARFDWPALPARLLIDEIQQWWQPKRHPMSRRVHGFYRTVAGAVTLPVRAGWRRLAGPPSDPLESFRAREKQALVRAVEISLHELDRMAQAGNDVLRPQLERLLGGASRASLLSRIQESYDQLPAIGQDYREFVWSNLDHWAAENPGAVKAVRSFDNAMAMGRPAITVALVVSGAAWTGVDHAMAQAAGGAVAELIRDTVVTATVTGGAETAVTVAGEGVKKAVAQLFADLQSGYARLRAEWLAVWLDREFLGDMLGELRRGADAPSSEAFLAVEDAVAAVDVEGQRSRDEIVECGLTATPRNG